MKWLVYLAILGLVEVAVIGRLHDMLGFYNLIGLYILTTIIGAVFLLIQLPEFRRSWKFINKLGKGDIKKFRNPDYKPTENDIEQLRPLLFFTLYFFATAHIAIPGIVSDFIGAILIVPLISNYYLARKIKRTLRRVNEDKP